MQSAGGGQSIFSIPARHGDSGALMAEGDLQSDYKSTVTDRATHSRSVRQQSTGGGYWKNQRQSVRWSDTRCRPETGGLPITPLRSATRLKAGSNSNPFAGVYARPALRSITKGNRRKEAPTEQHGDRDSGGGSAHTLFA